MRSSPALAPSQYGWVKGVGFGSGFNGGSSGPASIAQYDRAAIGGHRGGRDLIHARDRGGGGFCHERFEDLGDLLCLAAAAALGARGDRQFVR